MEGERGHPVAYNGRPTAHELIERLHRGFDEFKDQVVEWMQTTTTGQAVLQTEVREIRSDVDSVARHFSGDGDSLPTRMAVLEAAVERVESSFESWKDRDEKRRQQEEGEKRTQVRSIRVLRWQVGLTILVCLVTIAVSYIP